MSLRDRLIHLIEENNPELDLKAVDGASLIRSGLIDSLGLFTLALWIEGEIGSKIDLTTLNPSKEWDTIETILNFIDIQRVRPDGAHRSQSD